jgi:thiamine transport system permease protein
MLLAALPGCCCWRAGAGGTGAAPAGAGGRASRRRLCLRRLAMWQDDYLRWRVLWSLLQACHHLRAGLAAGPAGGLGAGAVEFAGRTLVLRLLMLPFVVPTLVAALGVLALWGPRGCGRGAGGGCKLAGHALAAAVRQPVLQPVPGGAGRGGGPGQVSAARVAAARTLGATPWRAFWRVEWPAILPWLGIGQLCLVFLYVFRASAWRWCWAGSATPRSRSRSTPWWRTSCSWPQARRAGPVDAAADRRWWRWPMPASSGGWPRRRGDRCRASRPRWRAVAGVVGRWGAGAGLRRALLAIGCAGGRSGRAPGRCWPNRNAAALWNTAALHPWPLLLATLLGVTHALARARRPLLRALPPFALCGVAGDGGLWPAAAVSGSGGQPAAVAGGRMRCWPIRLWPMRWRRRSMACRRTHDAGGAHAGGHRRWRVFWRVTLPLVAPALRRGMAFAAATALGEFAVTLFLSRPEWATLTTLIYQRLGRPGPGQPDAALVLACMC